MKIQSLYCKMGESSCLALDYIYYLCPKKATDFEKDCFLTASLLSVHEAGIIDDDMFVTDAVKLLEYLDPTNKYTVAKKDITSMTELKGTKGTVRFDYNGFSHWVYQEDGIILFDSLDNSKCRKYGKPVSARIITKKDKENK